jgi:hypothetical protein
MSTKISTEQMIQDRGLNTPKLNQQHIDNTIASEYYHTVPNTTLTFCVLTLQNGWTVSGESAGPSLSNFDAEIGRKEAKENAIEKVCILEGYFLKQKLYESEAGN